MFNTSHETFSVTEPKILANTVTVNNSVPDGCIEVRFDELEYLPWDNSDTLVSTEVEGIVHRIKYNSLVILFLIGGPANVINMAVFYKQGLKERINLCLFALSLADEILLIYCMFSYGEQVHIQFTTKADYGPMTIFIANNNLIGFYGAQWVSQILSAIIATERCFCICSPLKFQTLLQTRTMAVIIVIVYIIAIGFFFLVAFRYRIGCIYNPVSGEVSKELVIGEFYKNHKDLINYFDSFVYGVCIPGMVILVVVITTIITNVKLRYIMTWRAGTSSSVSTREVALTKMLIGNSLLFIVCITPVGMFRIAWVFMPELHFGKRNHNLYLVSLWIIEIASFINSTFNIFVYYTMGSRYRDTFWALFSRQRKLDTK